MQCTNPFNYLPILGTYRLTYYRATVLRAPPTVLRLCVLLEIAVALGVFALTYYYTATTSTTETVVTYEAKGSPYSCNVLSPRSDMQTYNTKSSEMAAFSQTRYDYSECTTALDNYEVCSETYRKDYLLSIGGVGTENSGCRDVILKDNYRFCYGKEQETSLKTNILTNQFPTDPDLPTQTYSQQYFFMNSSSHVQVQGNFDNTGDILSDFVSDHNHTVFVVVAAWTGLNSNLYQFDVTTRLVKKMVNINSVNIYGITYGNNKLYILGITTSPNPGGGNPISQAAIYQYEIVNKTLSTPTTFLCPGQGEIDTASASKRYLSFGSDEMLYVFCYESANPQSGFTYMRVDPKTWQSTVFTANVTYTNVINERDEVTLGTVNSISQVLRVGSNIYFTSTTPYNNLLRGSLQGVIGNKISNVTNLGIFPGDSILVASDTVMYFSGSENHTYYNTVDRKFYPSYPLVSDASYYYATYVQLGFAYQICNGNHSNYAVEYNTDTSFSSKCSEINGIHYQTNSYFTVPPSCQGVISSTTESNQLLSCPAVAAMQQDFADDDCKNSIGKVCNSEFTSNPPFSCSREVYASFLTIIATAIANSSGAWSVVAILLQMVLKIFYPHGTIDFDYDESVNRFLPLRDHDQNYWHHAKLKIHPTLSHRGGDPGGIELMKVSPDPHHYQPTNRAEYEQRLEEELHKGDIEDGRGKYHRK